MRVADIANTAGVDLRVFYRMFDDKQQAFLAAHELGFQHTMAVSAGAFFSAENWPERLWRGILAGAQFQATHPTLTHVLYVQSYAIGVAAVQRIDATHDAFTIFLQEGNEHTRERRSKTILQAIVAANFEIVFHLSRQCHGDEIPRFAPLAGYLCLAPFLSPAAAEEFIDSKISSA